MDFYKVNLSFFYFLLENCMFFSGVRKRGFLSPRPSLFPSKRLRALPLKIPLHRQNENKSVALFSFLCMFLVFLGLRLKKNPYFPKKNPKKVKFLNK